MIFKINKYPYKWLIYLFSFLALCWTGNTSANAQEKKTRILFVLDASGSMAGKWDDKTKYEIATSLLSNSIDSLEKNNKNIEFGLRVFGHQYSRNANNCEDSKLEVNFARNNSRRIQEVFSQVVIQGQTPIAYSLFQAATDFPKDPSAKNVIILITDGLETCNGDPCAVAEVLQQNRISLKPFIIGLGMGEVGKNYFDCVGTYYDAQDQKSFENALNIVVSQAINNTTAQVNLLDIHGKATETNVEMIFYDSYSGSINYMMVHAMNAMGRPDTLYINPVGKYDLVVNTIPPVRMKNIELTPGKHNIIALEAPQGQLYLNLDGQYGFSDVQAVIRQAGQTAILDVQSLNTKKKLLVGKYDLEILTLPKTVIKNVSIEQSKDTEIKIPSPGNLNMDISRAGIASIYVQEQGKMILIHELKEVNSRTIVSLQPGDYNIVYRPNKFQSAELTQTKNFKIYSKSVTNVRF